MSLKAALFDLGGVVFTSPFEQFAEYEREVGLPEGFIRRLNATNPDHNAWARLERNEVSHDEFCDLFEAEAMAAGGTLDGRAVMACLRGDFRPEVLAAIRVCRTNGLKTAAITNNWVPRADRPEDLQLDADLFDLVIESSVVGMRKPDPRIYELACEQLGIAPHEAVFLDDLGVNLKPARALGMTTIKVVDPHDALRELEAAVGFSVRLAG